MGVVSVHHKYPKNGASTAAGHHKNGSSTANTGLQKLGGAAVVDLSAAVDHGRLATNEPGRPPTNGHGHHQQARLGATHSSPWRGGTTAGNPASPPSKNNESWNIGTGVLNGANGNGTSGTVVNGSRLCRTGLNGSGLGSKGAGMEANGSGNNASLSGMAGNGLDPSGINGLLNGSCGEEDDNDSWQEKGDILITKSEGFLFFIFFLLLAFNKSAVGNI
jgi:hypothetical protein